MPMGLETTLRGLIDLITKKSIIFDGPNGENIIEGEIPEEFQAEAEAKRIELIEKLAEVDEEIEDRYLSGEELSVDVIKKAIRRNVIERKFFPVLMGSAIKNKGVQLALNAVIDYLPNPLEKDNYAFDL
jgi:elongation factor G